MKKIITVLFLVVSICVLTACSNTQIGKIDESNEKVAAVLTELQEKLGDLGLSKNREEDKSMWQSIVYSTKTDETVDFRLSPANGNILQIVVTGSEGDSFQKLYSAVLECKSLSLPEGIIDAVGSAGGNGTFEDIGFEASQGTDGSLSFTITWLSELM